MRIALFMLEPQSLTFVLINDSYYPNRYRFAQADIHDSALELIDALLTRIEMARTPEKVAENDHLMKCMSILLFYSSLILTPL